MAAPPLPQRNTPADQTSQWLQYQHANQTTPTQMYLHPRPLSFYTGRDKVDWMPIFDDAQYRDTYSTFTNSGRNGATQAVGLFQTWGQTWVGQPARPWENDEWHAWLGATAPAPNQPGKTVLLWDSEATNTAYEVAGRRGREPIFNDLIAP
jgi:hypothetical protein